MQQHGLVGETIGGFEILEPLGSGAFGDVYEARDDESGKCVAVKVLRPHLRDSDELARRLELEATLASRIHHPNVVDIVDVGRTDDGVRYLCMEKVEGVGLDELIATTTLPLARVNRIGAQLLDALHEAHRRGVVHADIKPENIMVEDRDGRDVVKLIDFGIASPSGSSSGRSDTVCGTPQYMAPEIGIGQAPTPASDLYAAGVVLYEALVGDVPFSGDSPLEILEKHQTAPFSPVDGLPRALASFFSRAFAKDPRDRFAHGLHMLTALDLACRDASLPRRTPRPADRRDAPTVKQVRRVSSVAAARRAEKATELRRRVNSALAIGDAEVASRCYGALARQLVAGRDIEGAVAALYEGIETTRNLDKSEPSPLHVMLAECYLTLDDRERAFTHAAAALRGAQRSGRLKAERRARAIVERLRREALASPPGRDIATAA